MLLREKFGDLPAGYDGLVAVGVAHGAVYLVNSTLAPGVSTPEPATLSQYGSRDTRETWCATKTAGCDRVIAGSASPPAWDVDPAVSGTDSTHTARATTSGRRRTGSTPPAAASATTDGCPAPPACAAPAESSAADT